MNGYYEQLCKVLKANGCKLLRRGKGSHEIWCDQKGRPFTVPFHCQSRHTANGILKERGIDHHFS